MKTQRLEIRKLLAATTLLISATYSSEAQAELKCLKLTQRNGKINSKVVTTSSSKCPRGTTKLFDTVNLVGPQGPAGAAGAAGANGEDGQMRIYGDGSAGDLVVTGTKTLRTDIAADGNFQFENCTVSSGSILYVPSGTILRCKGNLQVNGTIYVNVRQRPADNIKHAARAGIGGEAADIGECGDDSALRNGARRVNGLYADDASQLLKPGTNGGGDGGSDAITQSPGAGSFTVLTKGLISISNTGSIAAVGASGALNRGGGGGGVIILASKTSITNSGSLIAIGGSGGNRGEYVAASGGGGGGIVHLISPEITQGTINVSGGAAGTPTGTAYSTAYRCGGSSGGASAGDGGAGAFINVIGSAQAAEAGGAGASFTTYADPTSLY